jgi:hypothetical protein
MFVELNGSDLHSHLERFIILSVTNQNDMPRHSFFANISLPLCSRYSVLNSFFYQRCDGWRLSTIPIVIPKWILSRGSPQLSSGKQTVVLDCIIGIGKSIIITLMREDSDDENGEN